MKVREEEYTFGSGSGFFAVHGIAGYVCMVYGVWSGMSGSWVGKVGMAWVWSVYSVCNMYGDGCG